MHRHLSWFFAGIIALFLLAGFTDLPSTPGFHILGLDVNPKVVLGLDLKGGVSILYCAKPGQKYTSSDMSAARDIIEKRATSGLAVTAPQITVIGGNCIDAEIPGAKDPTTVINRLGKTGLLVLGDTGVTTQSTAPGSGVFVKLTSKPADVTKRPPLVHVVVPGKDIVPGTAGITYDTTGLPLVNYSLNSAGSNAWCKYTENNVGKFSPVVLDKQVIVDATINQTICGGQTQVSGLSLSQAKSLVIDLNYGALPVQLKVNSSQDVGATLGPQYVHKAVVAGIVGLLLVALFMLFYYRLPGALADIALFIYACVVFAIFKLIPVTLTLEGAAGFILSIGMAVDANVLIFERVKEELRAGKTLGAAIDSGFNRAWTSIRDSNISTMITTLILFWFGQHFGTSIITGFAETLFIGVAVSMFTAIVVTRTFLRLLVASGRGRSLALFGVSERKREEPAVLGGSVV